MDLSRSRWLTDCLHDLSLGDEALLTDFGFDVCICQPGGSGIPRMVVA